MSRSEFDDYADSYESALQKGLNVSGESSEYFAIGRVKWVRRRLEKLLTHRLKLKSVLDFGCGTGNSVAFLLGELQAEHVTGIDTSEQSLVQARDRYSSHSTEFVTADNHKPSETFDLAFCNGVFHHIPVELRAEVAKSIYRSLKPGGWFAFWENNPWNPGTRLVMSRIPFDRDAITLSIPESKRLLKGAGFEIESVDTCFYFPNLLSVFRPLEPYLSWLPLGAQYMVLVRKPALV